MKSISTLVALIVAFMAYNAECFQISNIPQLRRSSQNIHKNNKNNNSRNKHFQLYDKKADDFDSSTPGGDSFGSDNSGSGSEIDWDAEWKKVAEDRRKGTDIDRPGQDFYKNDVQRAAAKATRQASDQISKVKIVKPDINMRMLQGDAKFWIAILAVISVGLALATAPDMGSIQNSNESFYI